MALASRFSAALAEWRDYRAESFHVLLTGFHPFLNFSDNPTAHVAEHLNTEVCSNVTILPEPDAPGVWAIVRVCWHVHVLPVNRSGAMWTTEHLHSRMLGKHAVPYDAVFHMGMEDTAKGLKLEVAASNTQANDTGKDGDQPAMPGMPKIAVTTVDIGWLSLDTLAKAAKSGTTLASVQELWSRDPGKYYCNEVYYRTLLFVRKRRILARTGGLLPVMFIHMPNSTESSYSDDAEVVSQIVAHSLWATYLATPILPSPNGDQQAGLLLGRGGLVGDFSAAMMLGIASLVAAVSCTFVGVRLGWRKFWSSRGTSTNGAYQPLAFS